MSKVTLNDVTNLNNQQSTISTINGNSATIETAFDNTLSRDGSSPNEMESTLDMNSNHIINLPEPAGYEEPLRLGDITNFIDQFALVQTPSPGDAGKIIRVRADEIAYDISSTIIDAGSNNLYPVNNDTGSLGTSSNKWADLFLASGAVINFNSGDVTITHSSDTLSFSGAASGYVFDADIYRNTNFFLGYTTVPYINFDTGDYISYDLGSNLYNFVIGSTVRSIQDSASLKPGTNDLISLGISGQAWSDLFLASGAVVNFNAGDVTITHAANNLLFAGAANGYTFDAKIYPTSNDGSALGDTTHNFSDLFLASGAVINFNNGDVTITHSSNVLAFAGASTNYTFDANVNPATNDGAALGTSSLKWSDLFLASGSVIDFNSSDVTITHSADQLTIAGLGAYTVGSTGGLQVNNDIVSTGGAMYALGGAIPTSTSVPGVYFGKESANNNRAIQIVSPTAGSAYIDFAPVSVDFDGRILVDTSAHTMAFSVNGTEEVKISATATYPSTSDGNALGTTTNMWSDIFLASGAVINFNNSDVTVTHNADNLAFAGGTYQFDNKIYPTTNDGAALGDTTHNFSDLFLASGAVINFNNGNVTLTHSSGTLTTNANIITGTGNTITAGNFTLANGSADGGNLTFQSTGFNDWTNDNSSGIYRWYNNGTTYLNLNTTNLYPGANDLLALGTSGNSWADLFLASGAVINFNNSNMTITHSANNLTIAGGSVHSSGDLYADSALYLTNDISPTISVSQNDWSPSGFSSCSCIRVNAANPSLFITGIAGGADGRMITLHNVGVNSFTLTDSDTNSGAGNRFLMGADFPVAPSVSITFRYDATDTKWRPISTGGGGGSGSNAYGHLTDGTNAANSSGDDTIYFRAGTGLKTTIGSNDPTYGDNLLVEYNINGATVDSTPDVNNDYAITYDASATTHKKVLLNKFSNSAALDANFGSTQGQILYRGSSAWSALAPSTTGSRLITRGSSAGPIWQGTPVSIASGSLASQSTVNVTNIPATYSGIRICVRSTGRPSGLSNVSVRFSTNNGSTWNSTSSNYLLYNITGSVINEASMMPSNAVVANTTNDSNFDVMIFTHGAGLDCCFFNYSINRSAYTSCGGGMIVVGSNPINAIQIALSSNSFNSGTYAVYGLV